MPNQVETIDIRDTAAHPGTIQDYSKNSSAILKIVNGLDQDVSIAIETNTFDDPLFAAPVSFTSKTVIAGAVGYIPVVGAWKYVRMIATALLTPTTGSLELVWDFKKDPVDPDVLTERDKGVADGVCPLDGSIKIPLTYIPASVLDHMDYKGPWDASGGTMPTSPDNGDTYRISVAGTLPVVGYAEVGDLLVYDLPTTTWTLFQTNMTIGDLLGNVQENGANLNASEIVETNGLKKFITAVKNGAYNKAFDIVAGSVMEGHLAVLLGGRSGGQTIQGGTGAGEGLKLEGDGANGGTIDLGITGLAKNVQEIDESTLVAKFWHHVRRAGLPLIDEDLTNKGYVDALLAFAKQLQVYSVSGTSGTSGGSGGHYDTIDTISNAITEAGAASTIVIEIDQTVASETFNVPAGKIVYLTSKGALFSTNAFTAILGDGAILFSDNDYLTTIKEASGITNCALYLEECVVDEITDNAGTGNPTNMDINIWNSWIDTGVIAQIEGAASYQGNAIDYNDGRTILFGGIDVRSKTIKNVPDPITAQEPVTKNYGDTTYEPIFSKNTAFNKNLGFTSANVPRGDLVQQLSQKDANNGYAGLDAAGLLNPAQLPPLAITDTFVVASEVAQLALTVQKGDVAVRSDENKSYINVTGNNVSMADWQLLLTPTDAILSVFSRTGVVTAQNGDYIAGQVTNVPAGTVAAVTVQAAIDELDTEKVTQAEVNTSIGTHTAIAGAHHTRPVQATESVVGIAEIATQAETDAGTDDTRMITPKKLAAFPLPVFGTEFASSESTSESTYTGTTTPQTKTSITKTSPPSGNYLIQWSCQLSEDDENKQAIVDLYDGASVIDKCKFTPKKKWGDANESYPKFGGSLVVALSATTTFSLRYATNDSGKTVAIKNARMQIWRVS